MSENEQTIAQVIAEARFRARRKWLDEHPEVRDTAYGHAHGIMAQGEANVAEEEVSPGYLENVRKHLIEKYGIDTSILPEG